MQSKARSLAGIALVLLLVAVVSLSTFAQEAVEVRVRVVGEIVLTIWAGATIDFDMDPVTMPEAVDRTELVVTTNAKSYAITGKFSKFKINGYGLIENEKFLIRSIASGSGKPIDGWTPPEKNMVILEDEDGLTEDEVTVVEYLLRVDFSVPAGEGYLNIVYTAAANF